MVISHFIFDWNVDNNVIIDIYSLWYQIVLLLLFYAPEQSLLNLLIYVYLCDIFMSLTYFYSTLSQDTSTAYPSLFSLILVRLLCSLYSAQSTYSSWNISLIFYRVCLFNFHFIGIMFSILYPLKSFKYYSFKKRPTQAWRVTQFLEYSLNIHEGFCV